MLVSYIVSIGVLIGAFFFGVLVSGSHPAWYTDIPSLVVIVVPSLALCAGDYGWRAIGTAFSASFGKKPLSVADLRATLPVVAALGRYVWYAAVLGVFIGTIAILGDLADMKRIGPNFAVALICPLYALVINFALISPMKHRIARRIETGEQC
ncbi:MAG: hypothetical protein WCT14_08890 [Treponemataceae bacterium]